MGLDTAEIMRRTQKITETSQKEEGNSKAEKWFLNDFQRFLVEGSSDTPAEKIIENAKQLRRAVTIALENAQKVVEVKDRGSISALLTEWKEE
jgi:hypothetical protein